MARCPTILPSVTVDASQELRVMGFWRDGERSVNNLVKRSRVKSDQVWAILHKYAVQGAAKP